MSELEKYAELIEKFYANPFYLSYSGLNKLLYSPRLFYKHYVLQEQEEKIESYLIDGKVIHCLLLDPKSFDEQFILIPSTLPTDNTRRLVDAVYEKVKESPDVLDTCTVQILEYLKEVNLHQSLKTDQQRLDKILTEDAKSYFLFLKNKGTKNLIDNVTLERCTEAVNIFREDITVRNLLGLGKSEFDNVELFNEFYIEANIDQPFGLKGIVDNIQIDHDTKSITVNDIKTSSKTLDEFPETIEFYNYWAQAAIYHWLVMFKFYELVEKGYTVNFNFIVIDRYQQVYCFPVSENTMKEWKLLLNQKLEQFAWHYNTRRYDLPYKFANGNVTL